MNSLLTWEQRLACDRRRVIVLDDDPTGTQSVADVEVILRPQLSAYRRFLRGSQRAVYVLTNSRALSQSEAVSLLRRAQAEIFQAAREAGERVSLLLRGDSTLRGHVFAEMDVLAEAQNDAVLLFIPAFPEGGRVTLNGVHYLITAQGYLPVVRTEFARDSTFGYRSETLREWVAEVGQGRRAISLPLERLRTRGPDALTQVLLEAPAGTVVVPDVEADADLEMLAWGLLDAEERGRQVVVRSASPFAAIRAGLRGMIRRPSLSDASSRVLVVCGSHTSASTAQLTQLERHTTSALLLPTDELLDAGPDALVARLAERINSALQKQRFALLATERVRQTRHSDLTSGAKVMAALTAIVSRVTSSCDALISKGGITSAQIASEGLAATRAYVEGQLKAGVSLWSLTLPDARTLPYAVIPGNIGDEQTLVEIARLFGVRLLHQNSPYT